MAPRETAAGDEHAHQLAPMVAAGIRVASSAGVHPRRAAELAHHNHHRRVEQTSLIEVGHERGDGQVKRRQDGSNSRFEARVQVPLNRSLAEGQRHEPHARLDKPPRD